ncbi:MAG: multicopper oxidase family protein [Nostocoides sp.]
MSPGETPRRGFNGSVPGPTLRIRPGDTLAITLDNALDRPTNLHTHGLHVSPEGNSDNPFRMVAAGKWADYDIVVPADHPTGTFWYHPHHHGMVAEQVFNGLLGAIIVADDHEPDVDRDRVMIVSDTTLTSDGQVPASHMEVMQGREGQLVLINGVVNPRIELSPGTIEGWRMLNACTSRYLDISLDGHTLGLLGRDGQGLTAARDIEHLFMPPGSRADLLVRALADGTYAVRTTSVDRIRPGQGMGMGMGMDGSQLSRAMVLATVAVTSNPASTSSAATPASAARPTGASGWPDWDRSLRDLTGAGVDAQRRVTFTMGMGGTGGGMFEIDGRVFDPQRVDVSARLGTVEEWTIANTSVMDHPFHLHVWPFQVTDAPDHDPGGPPDWRDVINVPAAGQVTVRVPIETYAGTTVYHCHILDHEDLGMMGMIRVTA